MEAAVMNLMTGKSSLAGTPLGKSVKKIIDVLEIEMKPAILNAHHEDQTELKELWDALKKCRTTKESSTEMALPNDKLYKANSKHHKECRASEAVQYSSKESCLKTQRGLYEVKVLKCDYFAQISNKFGSTFNNQAIVTKAGGESVQSYIHRIEGTICGKHVHGETGKKKETGGWGGGLQDGFYDQYLRAKFECNVATKAYNDKVAECKRKIHEYNVRKDKCNQFQTIMDGSSCKYAVLLKDTCEQYNGCYTNRLDAFEEAVGKTKLEERDRKAEWRGVSRISCLINAFADNKVEASEIDACKHTGHDTSHLTVWYPPIPPRVKCTISKLYPSTGEYKMEEFGPLPTLAKGKISVPCSGVEEIPTTPKKGSPPTCKCRRVTLEGHYRAGPLVKCTKCHDVHKKGDHNSCPVGTKIWAPSNKNDWRTFLGSAEPLRDPHWIVDITRPKNGCGPGCGKPFNSHNPDQKSWRTSDGSPWWLRDKKYAQPSGDYTENCYLNLAPKGKPKNEHSVTFDDKGCNYHSKSYYCQKKRVYVKPAKGSPISCKCQPVTLSGKYSAGMLVKCEQCIKVSKSEQKNSCPKGMKIFSPRSRADWKTFIVSAQPLRAPNFIIDITRPQNGCGGCTKYAMNSHVPQQATWKTSDGSAWWLRSSLYSQPNGPEEWPEGRAKPNGDYQANCYMDLWRLPSNENTIQFNDQKCNYRSRSYYCQPVKPKPKPPAPPAPPPPRMLVPWTSLRKGVKEEVFYLKRGVNISKVPQLEGKSPSMFRIVKSVNYPFKTKAWSGFAQKDHFAVRWSGFLLCPKWGDTLLVGPYEFQLKSDDGSNLYIDKKKIINNDGVGPRTQTGKMKLVKGQHNLRLEYFNNVGRAGVQLKWKGGIPGSTIGNKFTLITNKYLTYQIKTGFREEVFYMKQKDRVADLNKHRPTTQRVVKEVNYPNTKPANFKNVWKNFKQNHDFAVRWSGVLKLTEVGTYKFSLKSDDGSRMFLNRKLVINNDGLHSWRQAQTTLQFKSATSFIIVEYFQKDKEAGISFRYMGPDTKNKMEFVGIGGAVYVRYASTAIKGVAVPLKTPALPNGTLFNNTFR